jgi:DNA-binding transcriptional ArsR family regulator
VDPFVAIADPTRRRIVELLVHGPQPARRIAGSIADISRPAVSRHLRVLRDAGLVDVDAVGRERIYRSTTGGLDPVHGWLDAVRPSPRRTARPSPLEALEPTLDALETEVRRSRRERARPAAGTAARATPTHQEHSA